MRTITQQQQVGISRPSSNRKAKVAQNTDTAKLCILKDSKL